MTQKAAGQTNQAVKAPAAVPQLLLQRACACGQHTSGGGECAECRKRSEGTLQRSAFGPASAPAAPPIVHDVLRSPGRRLDGAARAFMEPRFGRDFSGVRVHTDDRAAESARSVQALAYTVGRDVVFGAGQYAPATKAGRGLLAHELTHVVQQDGASHSGQLQHKLSLSSPGDAGEREADQMAAAVVSGRDGPVPGFRASAPAVQRACGPVEVGTVAGCTGISIDVACASSNCQRVHFVINCDDFTAGDEALLLAFAATVAPGDTLEVHGFASQDGDPTFNENLSCQRAQKAIAILTDPAKGNVAAAQIGQPFMHGATDGPKAERRSVEILKTSTTPTPVPPVPVPSPPIGCPGLPTSTPSTCADRHKAYCDAATCFPGNPWLSCACIASGQVCNAIDAFMLDPSTMPGAALLACVMTPSFGHPLPSPPGPIVSKGVWFMNTNRCIWGHWRAAFDAIHDSTRPIPGGLTAEWTSAVTICRRDGIGSGTCCQAHVRAEQNAIDHCGLYDSISFGSLPTDVPGAPGCSYISSLYAFAIGPEFTGDFGSVADRVSYGNKRCCP